MENALELLSIHLHLLPDLYIRGVTGSFISRVNWWSGWGSWWISASVHEILEGHTKNAMAPNSKLYQLHVCDILLNIHYTCKLCGWNN